MNNVLGEINIFDICTGCRTCENVCPQKCISMKEDDNGFIYPTIDNTKCVNCGICKKKCHALQHNPEKEIECVTGYCAWASDDLRMRSSSGGIFSAIIDSLPGEEWDIFGAAFSDDWMSVNHVKRQKNNYEDIRKSKYVFSDLKSCFNEVIESLQSGRHVSFSGTPCQIGALHRFLGTDYSNLLTIDIICHGISPTALYKEHLNFISDGREVVLVDFRPKGFGWDSRLRINFNNGNVYLKDQKNDLYLYSYFSNLSLRNCCYHCSYSGNNHLSDITLGDFWRIEKFNPEYRKEPGVAMVLCNSEKGKRVLESLDVAHMEQIDSEYFKYAFNDGHSWYKKSERDDFFKMLHAHGLAKLERQIYYRNLPYNIARKIKKKLLR